MKTNVIITLLTVMVIAVLSVPIFPALAVEDGDTKKVIAYASRQHIQNFDIQYIHSIHRTPVFETYRLDGTSIIQQQITYEEFAVGMPSNDDGEGTFIQQDGRYMITDMNRIFPFLDVRIAQVMPDHGIRIQDEYIPFEAIAKPGSWIRITVRKISIWQKLKGVDLFER